MSSMNSILSRLNECVDELLFSAGDEDDELVFVLGIIAWYYCMYLDKAPRHTGLFVGADYAEHLLRSSELRLLEEVE
jgi:hypothetical protein